MITSLKNLVAEHQGSSSYIDERTTVHKEREYTIFESITRAYKVTVVFRNVGELNPDHSIQFSLTEYNYRTNRTKHTSFNIPLALAELFITSIQEVKTAKDL